MRGVKVVVLVHREGLSRGNAGAHAAGASVLLAPVRAQKKPGLAQAGLRAQIAHAVHGDTLRIGQQHAVAQAGHLLVQRFQAMARNMDEVLHLVLVCAQAVAGQDDGFLRVGGVQAVLLHAAQPRGLDDLVMHQVLRHHMPGAHHAHDRRNMVVLLSLHELSPLWDG